MKDYWCGTVPQVGDIWQENDNRFTRQVLVVAIVGDKVEIKSGDRTTKASLKRFNGKSGGYSFVRSKQ
jgi:hypothetical protein